ncbi:MAG TPA: DUF3500 domain-containing protein [Segeticoccus sp.]|uniref:DUF3500 domain-containing protein n=1 Tax=Segeticoccus sp. TaxID=2706531 RepID=UPI002D7E1F93|nr:DUF3500 domain-containing protein [Segeticoccus sp.]HET8598897.1 DUF3500 domain-containing protein [Segeticoccus sp.]
MSVPLAGLAGRMRAAAEDFLVSLDETQRKVATAAFDSDDRRRWTYLPGPRPGLALADMTVRQRGLAMVLMDSGLSAAGARTARDVMELDGVLRELEREAGKDGWDRRDPRNYWFHVLGDPTGDGPWMWKVGGHHLALHLTVVGDFVSGSPQFFGANPAVVPRGPRDGWRVLSEEQRLADELVAALDADQRAAALVSEEAPTDIATRRDPVAAIGVVPRGLAHGDMDEAARRRLEALVRHYLGRLSPELADDAWLSVADAGLSETTFAWAGEWDTRPGHPHYYAVAGATFLLEYDNVQDRANHVHSVWRDVRHDWGEDLLTQHHQQSH